MKIFVNVICEINFFNVSFSCVSFCADKENSVSLIFIKAVHIKAVKRSYFAMVNRVDSNNIIVFRNFKTAEVNACAVCAGCSGDIQQVKLRISAIWLPLRENNTSRICIAVVNKNGSVAVILYELVERVAYVVVLEQLKIVFWSHGSCIKDNR